MIPLLWLNLSPARDELYHELLPMNTVYQGVLIDFVLVSAACVLLISLLNRWDSRCRTLLWLLVFGLLATRIERGFVVDSAISPLVVTPFRIFLGIAIPGGVLWLISRSWYSAAMRGLRLVILLMGFCVFWILPELSFMAFHHEPRETAGFSHPAPAPQRRIVWILFDEASYDQLFDHPFPGTSYPNFDRLAGDSVNFSNVRPAGDFTELVIPSLLSGHIVKHVESDLDGQLLVRTQDDPHWHLYPDRNSLFADAQHLGWSTGAVGWYNPYCRIFASELNDCYWKITMQLPGRYSAGRSALINAVAPLGKPAFRLLGEPALRTYADPWHLEAGDYEHIMQHAVSEITSDRVGFLFVHLPLPHPGGFYNRQTGQIGVPGSYIDGLALTDATLGELMHDIDASPLGPETTVIVSSDHSWRTWIWRKTTYWMPEDTRASSRGFDPRPLLLVHFPGEATGTKISGAFPLIRMHAMVDAMLAGKIQNAAQLGAWAATQ